MVDMTRAAATALRLIRKNGRTVSVLKLDTTPADASKPWRGAADQRVSADRQTIVAVEVPLVATRDIGLLVNKRDIPDDTTTIFLAAPELTTPDLVDYNELTDSGVTYRITFVNRLKPANTTIMYAIGVGK